MVVAEGASVLEEAEEGLEEQLPVAGKVDEHQVQTGQLGAPQHGVLREVSHQYTSSLVFTNKT